MSDVWTESILMTLFSTKVEDLEHGYAYFCEVENRYCIGLRCGWKSSKHWARITTHLARRRWLQPAICVTGKGHYPNSFWTLRSADCLTPLSQIPVAFDSKCGSSTSTYYPFHLPVSSLLIQGRYSRNEMAMKMPYTTLKCQTLQSKAMTLKRVRYSCATLHTSNTHMSYCWIMFMIHIL